MKHQLLPRSTGLLFSLRSLKINVENLTLYDITVGYPGVPPEGYAQDYHTLASIYTAHKQAPEFVSLHLRKYRLEDVPIGAVDKTLTAEQNDEKVTDAEKKLFDEWLRARWIVSACFARSVSWWRTLLMKRVFGCL